MAFGSPSTYQLVSGGNATVPGDAPIQPPQAFVDAIALFIHDPNLGEVLTCESKGIVSIAIDLADIQSNILRLWSIAAADDSGDPQEFHFAGNLFNQTTSDNVLVVCAKASVGTNVTVDLTGAGMAAPSLNGVSVQAAGSAPLNGGYSPRGTVNGKTYYNLLFQPTDSTQNSVAWSGSQWIITDSDGVTLYIGTGGGNNPWDVAVWSVGTGELPVPTVTHANYGAATILANGGTVTTN